MERNAERNAAIAGRRAGGRSRRAAREIAYIALSVSVLAVSAWISVPSTIPFTMQTFAVALLGTLLGWKRGTAAVLVYIFMGLVGIPVFSGFRAGTAALFGATGGYIFGFVFLAAIPALFARIPAKNSFLAAAIRFVGMILGGAVTYAFGTAWFMALYGCTLRRALILCVIPYIAPDLLKFVLAALLSVRLAKYVR